MRDCRLLRFWQHPEFGEGARAMLPVAPGIAAWGLMTGVAMMKSGLSLVESLAMALFVYAGSSQLAAMPLILAGAPAWVILATSCCVNLRFVVFSLHLRPYMMHLPLWRRMLGGYLTADLTYVMFTRRFPHALPKVDHAVDLIATGPQPAYLQSQKNLTHAAADVAQQLARQQAYLLGNSLVNWFSWVLQLDPSALGFGFRRCLGVDRHCLLACFKPAACRERLDCRRRRCAGVCPALALEYFAGDWRRRGGLRELGALACCTAKTCMRLAHD
jgi:predicted branched-subunit amino acid permease